MKKCPNQYCLVFYVVIHHLHDTLYGWWDDVVYFNSLLVFRFQDDYRSFRFISYDLAMFFMMFVGMTLAEDIKTRVMIFLVPIVNYAILFHWMNARKDEVQEKAIMENNRTINLLLAENE